MVKGRDPEKWKQGGGESEVKGKAKIENKKNFRVTAKNKVKGKCSDKEKGEKMKGKVSSKFKVVVRAREKMRDDGDWDGE